MRNFETFETEVASNFPSRINSTTQFDSRACRLPSKPAHWLHLDTRRYIGTHHCTIFQRWYKSTPWKIGSFITCSPWIKTSQLLNPDYFFCLQRASSSCNRCQMTQHDATQSVCCTEVMLNLSGVRLITSSSQTSKRSPVKFPGPAGLTQAVKGTRQLSPPLTKTEALLSKALWGSTAANRTTLYMQQMQEGSQCLAQGNCCAGSSLLTEPASWWCTP